MAAVVVAAIARQWALLNTNSRFHYAAVAELSERLAELAPDGLDQVFLVNSGSEAVDLAPWDTVRVAPEVVRALIDTWRGIVTGTRSSSTQQ